MPAMEPLYRLIGFLAHQLTDEQIFLLEANLLTCVCEELKEIFRKKHSDYFRLLKCTIEMEDVMLETTFVCLVIKDILATDEYSLDGIAHYTDTHEDVIEEIMIGRNANPSAAFLRKLIMLHRSVRRELYEDIFRKITQSQLSN